MQCFGCWDPGGSYPSSRSSFCRCWSSFFGPLIQIGGWAPLDEFIEQLIVILVMVFFWVVGILIGMLRRSRRNAKMAEEMAEGAAAAAPPGASDEEVTAIRNNIQEALGILKKSKLGGGKGGRQSVYQLPWYIIIGPPGAGKTTALMNSGLRFPLADQGGVGHAVKGVGGTRNCDWWFTEEAVLIDTAGRYTTQDSDQAVDAAAWTGFLGMLRRYRRRQPINGVIVAISVLDLITASEAERQAHARAVRLRLRELDQQLAVRFPVYVLFTKCDRIAGFVEFFDDLSKELREQVWGHTFPIEESRSDTPPVENFPREFDALIARLNERCIERLHQEQDFQRRSMIYGFPQQVASLRDPLLEFMREVFTATRYEKSPLLRGFYLSSGTQEGNPIDRLMGAMATTFGIGRQVVTGFSGSGRSYFLTRLLRGVIFPEASVVSANDKFERRRRRMQWLTYGVATCVLLGMGTIWTISYLNNSSLIANAEGAVQFYNNEVDEDFRRVSEADVAEVLRPLGYIRDMPAGYGRRDEDVPLLYGFGLYQGGAIGIQSEAAYRHALRTLFLPRVQLGLEEAIVEQIEAVEASGSTIDAEVLDPLFNSFSVYQILGARGAMDEDMVRDVLREHWNDQYGGPDRAETRVALSQHLDALIEYRITDPVLLNGELIARAGETLSNVPLAERAYARIVRLSQGSDGPPGLRATEMAGTGARRVFTDTVLATEIPGLYTRNGFYTFFLPTMIETAEAVADESWVLGEDQQDINNEQQRAFIERDILALYSQDYVQVWEELLRNLRLQRFSSNIDDAVRMLRALSGGQSPFRNLIVTTAEETRLTQTPDWLQIPENPADLLNATGENAGIIRLYIEYIARRRLSTTQMDVIDIAQSGQSGGGQTSSGEEPPPPGQYVEDQFREFHEFVFGSGSEGSELEERLAQMQRIAEEISSGDIDRATGPGSELADLALAADTGELPAQVQPVAEQVAGGAQTAVVGGASSDIQEAWNQRSGELCRELIANGYPIVRGAAGEISLSDFARVFSEDGIMQSFFDEHLVDLVDTSTDPWTLRTVEGVELGISQSDIVPFQYARDIQDAFWPTGGGGRPSVTFIVTPLRLDSTATGVILDIGGAEIEFRQSAAQPIEVEWPTQRPRASIQLVPETGRSLATADGPWAFFRLLDQHAQRQPISRSVFNAVFNIGGRQAEFEIEAGSRFNPFNLPALRRFSCPSFQ